MRYGHSNTSSAFFQIYKRLLSHRFRHSGNEVRNNTKDTYTALALFYSSSLSQPKEQCYRLFRYEKEFRLTARNVKHGKRIIRKERRKESKKSWTLGIFYIGYPPPNKKILLGAYEDGKEIRQPSHGGCHCWDFPVLRFGVCRCCDCAVQDVEDVTLFYVLSGGNHLPL